MLSETFISIPIIAKPVHQDTLGMLGETFISIPITVKLVYQDTHHSQMCLQGYLLQSS